MKLGGFTFLLSTGGYDLISIIQNAICVDKRLFLEKKKVVFMYFKYHIYSEFS